MNISLGKKALSIAVIVSVFVSFLLVCPSTSYADEGKLSVKSINGGYKVSLKTPKKHSHVKIYVQGAYFYDTYSVHTYAKSKTFSVKKNKKVTKKLRVSKKNKKKVNQVIAVDTDKNEWIAKKRW